jgi:tryptophan synthase alpha chain
MSKRLNNLIAEKKSRSEKLLSIFVTAGFPEKEAAEDIIVNLDNSGADFIELGIPFSDPVADGPVIQQASDTALKNGITLRDIIKIITKVRKKSQIPIILMGYSNPVYQYGFESFFKDAAEAGADGFILPDLPIEESGRYQELLRSLDLDLIHLIAPNTSDERIREIDRISTSFVYCVAYTGVTGRDNGGDKSQKFLEKLNALVRNPRLIGFGVKTGEDFAYYSRYADGVIVGSAFIRLLKETPKNERKTMIEKFIADLRNEQ